MALNLRNILNRALTFIELDNNFTYLQSLISALSTSTVSALNNKVDKVSNKQLSTNDYTDADKQIVDTEIVFNEDQFEIVNGEYSIKEELLGGGGGGGSSSPMGVLKITSVSEVGFIYNNGNFTQLTFSGATPLIDNKSGWSAVDNGYKIPAGQAGFYECYFYLNLSANTPASQITLTIDSTGDQYDADVVRMAIPAKTEETTIVSPPITRLLAAGDILKGFISTSAQLYGTNCTLYIKRIA